jgi:hypothetical protein
MHRIRGLSRGGRVLLALAVGGAVFGVATAVQASIPEASGVIHGCYNTSLQHGNPPGALRVIDTAKINGNCASWEAPLNWNANGATGAAGPTGPTGPTGPKGATGANGPSAFTGRIVGIPATPAATLASVWGAPSGLSASNGSSAAVETLSPNAPFVAQDFSLLKTGGIPPRGDSITVDFVVNGSPALVCAIETITSCQSVGTFAVPAGSTLSIEVTMDSAGGAIPGFDLLFGWRATS